MLRVRILGPLEWSWEGSWHHYPRTPSRAGLPTDYPRTPSKAGLPSWAHDTQDHARTCTWDVPAHGEEYNESHGPTTACCGTVGIRCILLRVCAGQRPRTYIVPDCLPLPVPTTSRGTVVDLDPCTLCAPFEETHGRWWAINKRGLGPYLHLPSR